jgi:hypothetical protein
MRPRKTAARRLRAALAASLLLASAGRAPAQTSEQIKPYLLLVLDISGSMDDPAATVSSCTGDDAKFDHAKCAIQQMVDSHGDIIFGLSRFRRATSGSCNGCGGGGMDCSNCNESNGSGCADTDTLTNAFELLVPVMEESAASVRPWVDFTCGSCSFDPAANPELDTSGWTPIGGSLRGARRYFQGNDPFYSSDLESIYGAAAKDPIRSDPMKDVFVQDPDLGIDVQCRPYIVITLTDGEETCEQFSGTQNAAGALLTTDVDGKTYRIQTRPIAFGQGTCFQDEQGNARSEGNSQIEAIAHAGGTADVAGSCEGLYAADEVGLTDALNQIIQDSIKVEECDGEDNDCDNLVDEGYQLYCDLDSGVTSATLCFDPGDDCDDSDDNCFAGTSDEPKNACGFCGPTPTEVCNNLDDDCDGNTDEGGVCNGCVPQGEICDDRDNDCDGQTDENLVRDCGSNVGRCQPGTEQCVDGSWINCTATGPYPEECNNQDDDCDGIVDDFTTPCTTLPDNNPGVGVCRAGTRLCSAGSQGACLGEVGPGPEACDLEDDDCDTLVDEDTGGADCSNQCGTGVTECVNGTITCTSSGTGADDDCDNNDDDCDGQIDEAAPPMGSCDNGGTLCIPGTLRCVAGSYVCTGGEPRAPEVCDCKDNDCDGQTDENPGSLCPSGASCTSCQCAYPCEEGEFPCPVGRSCNDDNFCVVNPCFGVVCPATPDGAAQVCVEGSCVPTCDVVSCGGGLVCHLATGQCVPDNCHGFPERCSATELCVSGSCVANPCAGVTCSNAGEYCTDGQCVRSCSGVECGRGQECVRGACVDTCPTSCGSRRVCDLDSKACIEDACLGVVCGGGQVCDPRDGSCVRDPCLGVTCPGAGQVCERGTCRNAGGDAGVGDRSYIWSGGGRGCALGADGSPAPAAWLLALATALLLRRRRGGAR